MPCQVSMTAKLIANILQFFVNLKYSTGIVDLFENLLNLLFHHLLK